MEETPSQPKKTVASLVIHWDMETGKIDIGGHLDNLLLNLQMLAEAGHILIERNAKLQQTVKENGKPN